MLSEHLVYSLAIGLAFGAVYQLLTGRNYWWIILASAFIPDLDLIADAALNKMGITVLVFGAPIAHGHFHNILVMLFYATAMAFLLHPLGIRLMDSFIFALVGFIAHMFEDAIVANPAYPFLYPLTTHRFGIGFFNYRADILGIADKEVLIVGIALLVTVMISLLVMSALWDDRQYRRIFRLKNPALAEKDNFWINRKDKLQ
jgi:LexA-binding, inner membrane-associated putative hydrolase